MRLTYKCDCPRPHLQETCQGITPLSSIGSPPTINLLHPVIHSGRGGTTKKIQSDIKGFMVILITL